MNYYDLDKILAEEEKLKVKFSHNIENFGFYINPSLQDIKLNTRADLPFFLIKLLLQNQFCTLLENPVLKLKHDLDATSSIVNLKRKYFYSLNKFFNDKSYLSDIFYERIGSFVPLLIKNDFNEDDLEVMSSEERRIIISARKKFKEFQSFYFNRQKDL